MACTVCNDGVCLTPVACERLRGMRREARERRPDAKLVVPGEPEPVERARPAKGRGGFPRPRVLLPEDPAPGKRDEPVHERMMAAVDELERRIRSAFMRVACPACRAPVGEVCRAMPCGWRKSELEAGGRLKHSHAARLRADGIQAR